MKKSGASQGQSASELISKRIAELGDWRGKTLSRMRKLIKEADPDVVEEWKWMGTPVWSHDGIICTGESYKNVVKLTFAKGASLKDPARLFNSSLDGNVRRAIDIHEGEDVDESAFKALVRQAVALNSSGKSKAFEESEVLGGNNGKQASDYDRRVYPGCPTRGPAAFAPAVRDPQERRAGGRGGDQVGNPLLRGAPIPVRFLRAQGTLNFAPTPAALEAFRKELEKHKTTKDYLQIPYNKPLPEDLVRKIAEYRLRDMREREDDAFW